MKILKKILLLLLLVFAILSIIFKLSEGITLRTILHSLIYSFLIVITFIELKK